MSRDCTGSLLTQQTVLGFSCHPPSPFGAGRLPQFVREQRGGQGSFAMNRHTQLQFNLGIPPHPANLATHFDPSHPSPVVIEKPFLAGRGEFKAVSAEKLSLAVRLARRDLKLGRYQPASSPQLCHSCREDQDTLSVNWNSNEAQVHCDEVPQALPQDRSCTDHEWGRDLEQPLPHQASPSRHQPCGGGELSASEVSVPGNRRVGDRSSGEVVRLRKELHKQVMYMKQLRELGRGNVVVATTAQRKSVIKKGRGVAGRVWMDEVKGEEEKLLQRREEQAVRDARIIYNLSQQVSSLQRDMQRLQLTDTPDNAKKSQATRRLAAIYRSALRLLHKYHSPGHTSWPLPPELSLLLQQVSLLSRHFGVGGANYELENTMKVLQELAGEQEKENVLASRQSVMKNTVALKPTRQKTRRQAKPAKKTSLILHPQLKSVRSRRDKKGPPHFAQQTESSRRRQPVHSPIKHSPALLHSSTPQGLEGERYMNEPSARMDLQDATSTPPNVPPHGPERDGNEFKPATTAGPNLPKDKATQSSTTISRRDEDQEHMPRASGEKPRIHIERLSREEEEERGVASPLSDQRLWLEGISATLIHHSKQLEAFKKSTQKQLSQLEEKLSTGAKSEKRSEAVSSSSEHISNVVKESEKTSESVVDRTKLDRLVERLRELEGEEELIRERWQTIAYEDPPLARRQVVVENSQEAVAHSPPPTLSTDAQQSISNYKQRFQHHLKLTGHSTQGGFNPWKMAESLADNLLSEVVDQVADELGHLCDEWVDNVFSNEFTPPTSSEENRN